MLNSIGQHSSYISMTEHSSVVKVNLEHFWGVRS